MLKQSAYLLLAACLTGGVAYAQSANGYAEAGPGTNSNGTNIAMAVGGEYIIGQTVGIGGELGLALRHSSFGFLSLDASIHLTRHTKTAKWDPYVIGGYTWASDLFAGVNGANFGFGVNYWLTRHFGFRGEFRDLVFPSVTPSNYWAIRGGIAFR